MMKSKMYLPWVSLFIFSLGHAYHADDEPDIIFK